MPPKYWITFNSCIVSAVFSSLLSGCGKRQDSAAWWAGEREREELSQQLELQKFRFEGGLVSDFNQLNGLHAMSRIVTSAVVSLRQRQEILQREVMSLQHRLAESKETALHSQRQRAMPTVFETLCVTSGRKFENVSITVIDDSGVTIRHSHGSARLRFHDLNAEQQWFFGLDAALGQAAHEKEARDAVAYENWIAKRTEINRLAEASTADIGLRGEIATIKEQTHFPTSPFVAAYVRPLAQPAKSVGSSTSRSYRYFNYRSERSNYRHVYYDSPNCINYIPTGGGGCQPQHYSSGCIFRPNVSSHESFFQNLPVPPTP